MSLKSEIIKAIQTKYKSLGFSAKAIDAVATLLDGTVEEESGIDTAVEGVEPLLKAFQGDADKRVTDAVKKAQTEKPEEKKKDEEVKTLTPNDEVPAWAKGLTDTITELKTELQTIKAGKTTESRKQTLESKLANANSALKAKILKDFNRMKFDSDEEFEAYLTETEEDIKGFGEAEGVQGSDKTVPPPVFGKTGKNGISNDTQAYIDAKKAENTAKTEGKQIFTT